MFEKRLKEIYPNLKDITYDISDLYNYIDALADLSALVFDPSTNTYAPHNKDWVKKKAFAHLKKQAGRGGQIGGRGGGKRRGHSREDLRSARRRSRVW